MNYDLSLAQAFFEAKVSFTTGVHELEIMLQQNKPGIGVIDVRYPADYAKGHVPGAVNVPKGKWHATGSLRKDIVYYVYCYTQTCHLGAEAALALTRQGFKVIEVEGGWATWEANGYPVERQTEAA